MTQKKKTNKTKILYYQFQEKTEVINFIYELRKKIYIAEVRRLPFEEGFLPFIKESGGEVLNSELNIHDFAAHLSTAYRKK